jgi:hypothetical protein
MVRSEEASIDEEIEIDAAGICGRSGFSGCGARGASVQLARGFLGSWSPCVEF